MQRATEREPPRKSTLSKSVAEVWSCHTESVACHNNGGRETHLPHFLWHATLATAFPELVGIGGLRLGNVVSDLVYFS